MLSCKICGIRTFNSHSYYIFDCALLKKGILQNFAKFTEKQPCQSLFFNKVVAPPVAGSGLHYFFIKTILQEAEIAQIEAYYTKHDLISECQQDNHND